MTTSVGRRVLLMIFILKFDSLFINSSGSFLSFINDLYSFWIYDLNTLLLFLYSRSISFRLQRSRIVLLVDICPQSSVWIALLSLSSLFTLFLFSCFRLFSNKFFSNFLNWLFLLSCGSFWWWSFLLGYNQLVLKLCFDRWDWLFADSLGILRALRGNYTLLDHLVGRHLIIIKSSTRCFVYFTLKFRSVDLVVEFTTTLILIAFNSLKNKDLRFIIFLVLERGLRSIARLSEMIWSRVRKRETLDWARHFILLIRLENMVLEMMIITLSSRLVRLPVHVDIISCEFNEYLRLLLRFSD